MSGMVGGVVGRGLSMADIHTASTCSQTIIDHAQG